MRIRTNRVISMQSQSFGLMRRLIRDDTSSGELVVFNK
jgi:hypothetical protein